VRLTYQDETISGKALPKSLHLDVRQWHAERQRLPVSFPTRLCCGPKPTVRANGATYWKTPLSPVPDLRVIPKGFVQLCAHLCRPRVNCRASARKFRWQLAYRALTHPGSDRLRRRLRGDVLAALVLLLRLLRVAAARSRGIRGSVGLPDRPVAPLATPLRPVQLLKPRHARASNTPPAPQRTMTLNLTATL